MNTGIKTADNVIEEFNNLRMKRSSRYIILKVNDDKTEVSVEHVGARDASFDEFKELMPKDACRYCHLS